MARTWRTHHKADKRNHGEGVTIHGQKTTNLALELHCGDGSAFGRLVCLGQLLDRRGAEPMKDKIILKTDEEEKEFWKERLKESRSFWANIDRTLDALDVRLKKIIRRGKDDGTNR